MSFNIGDALLAGLAGGAQQLGKDYERDKAQKGADERAKIAAVAKENYDKRMIAFKVSQEPPKYQTFDNTRDGKAGKRTVKSTYDAAQGKWAEEDVGFAPNKPVAPVTSTIRQGGDDVNTMFDPDTGGWKEIGRGPHFNPHTGSGGEGSGSRSPQAVKPTALTSAEIEALFGKSNAQGEVSVDPNDYRQFLSYQARNADRDSRFRDARFAAQTWANQVGVDPNEKLPGTIDVNEPAPSLATPKPAPAAPTSKAAPYPEGARLKGRDGRMYVVQNGQPVPVN